MKMSEDESNYEREDDMMAEKFEERFLKILKKEVRHVKKQLTSIRIVSSSARSAGFYGLPKVRKAAIPVRSVVVTFDAP